MAISEFSGLESNLLKKGTNYCFFTAHAFQSAFLGNYVLLGHYRQYIIVQYTKILLNQGFCVQKKGYFYTSLLFVRNIEKLIKKEPNQFIANRIGSKFKEIIINTFLGIDFLISQTLNKITGVALPGLYCYCLCKK